MILTSIVIGRLDTDEEGVDVAASLSGILLLEERGSRNSGTLDDGAS